MTSFEKIHKELCEYIDTKIPDIELNKRREIVMYAMNLFILREADVLGENNREWAKAMRRNQHLSHDVIEQDFCPRCGADMREIDHEDA